MNGFYSACDGPFELSVLIDLEKMLKLENSNDFFCKKMIKHCHIDEDRGFLYFESELACVGYFDD